MISAMIARKVKGRMEPVGTIDVDGKNFTFETEDKRLMRMLESVRKNGVETMGGDAIVDGVSVDRLEKVMVTEDTVGPLSDHLLDRGYHWWEEE